MKRYDCDDLLQEIKAASAVSDMAVSRVAQGPVLVRSEGPPERHDLGVGLLAEVTDGGPETRTVGIAYTVKGDYAVYVDRHVFAPQALNPAGVEAHRQRVDKLLQDIAAGSDHMRQELPAAILPELGGWTSAADASRDRDAIATVLAGLKDAALGAPAVDVLLSRLSAATWDLYNEPNMRQQNQAEWTYLRGQSAAALQAPAVVDGSPEGERRRMLAAERARLLGAEPRMREILPCIDPDNPVKYPVFLVGGPGSGKSTALHLLGTTQERMFDSVITVGAHVGMTSWDFIGGPKIDRTGWHHGPVARAFIDAAAGKQTLLLIDEVNRVPVRERSIFLSALSHNHHTKSFHLTVSGLEEAGGKRVDEDLRAPYANLSIVMTGNTEDCAVETAEKALDDRFRFVMFPITEDLIRRGMTANCQERGFPAQWGERFVNLMRHLTKLHEQHAMKQLPTMRGLTRALDTAQMLDPGRRSLEILRGQLEAESYTWVKRKGLEPVKEQYDGVLQAISKAFT